MKNWLKQYGATILVLGIIIVAVVLGVMLYNNNQKYELAMENSYNYSFYEFINYVDSMETYLAKSAISTSAEHGAETLTHIWREADLAGSYLAQLPIENQELANTAKFLNQVSDYSYTLSRKNIYNEPLTQEDLDNLTNLHNYSVELKNTLVQLSADMNDGRISWGELTKKGRVAFAQQVSNISQDSFSGLEENFHEYAGLIYDGAFSEHLTSPERKGLTGDDIDEEKAREIATTFFGQDRIEEISSNGLSENGNIPSYDFYIKIKNEKDHTASISISRKGGHVVFLNQNRDIEAEAISNEQADEIAKKFLNEKGFPNMKETYYLKQQGILTINYAYEQNGVTMYPDLIKVKVALDNGEILGVETTGYLNSHEERTLPKVKITKEEAAKTINKNLEINATSLAIIPTEFKTELLCWEFKGKVDDTEFLVYINAETGREEDILVIQNTPEGTLTM